MNTIVDPELRENIRKWYPSGEVLADEAEKRIKQVIKPWGLSNIQPLKGGGSSIVCTATRSGEEVVVKANLYPSDSESEKIGLTTLQTNSILPTILDYRYGVLLLEKLDGTQMKTYDGKVIAEILSKIHEKPRKPDTSWNAVPLWKERREILFDGYASRCQVRTNEFNDIIQKAEEKLPFLLEGSHTLIHGDILRKNILQNEKKKTYLIDPYTAISPLGWEFAHAACAVQAQNGKGGVIVEQGLDLKVENLPYWLLIASVHHARGNDYEDDTPRRVWLRELIEAYS